MPVQIVIEMSDEGKFTMSSPTNKLLCLGLLDMARMAIFRQTMMEEQSVQGATPQDLSRILAPGGKVQ